MIDAFDLLEERDMYQVRSVMERQIIIWLLKGYEFHIRSRCSLLGFVHFSYQGGDSIAGLILRGLGANIGRFDILYTCRDASQIFLDERKTMLHLTRKYVSGLKEMLTIDWSDVRYKNRSGTILRRVLSIKCHDDNKLKNK